jgi:hypothetical protein
MASVKKYLGREVKETHSFKVEGTFQSLYAALSWCSEIGYDTGSMCSPMPIGLMKGGYNLPWKWKNMNDVERSSVDGVIDSDDFREGEVTIYIFN